MNSPLRGAKGYTVAAKSFAASPNGGTRRMNSPLRCVNGIITPYRGNAENEFSATGGEGYNVTANSFAEKNPRTPAAANSFAERNLRTPAAANSFAALSHHTGETRRLKSPLRCVNGVITPYGGTRRLKSPLRWVKGYNVTAKSFVAANSFAARPLAGESGD